jgi:hypothetical protein
MRVWKISKFLKIVEQKLVVIRICNFKHHRIFEFLKKRKSLHPNPHKDFFGSQFKRLIAKILIKKLKKKDY